MAIDWRTTGRNWAILLVVFAGLGWVFAQLLRAPVSPRGTGGSEGTVRVNAGGHIGDIR